MIAHPSYTPLDMSINLPSTILVTYPTIFHHHPKAECPLDCQWMGNKSESCCLDIFEPVTSTCLSSDSRSSSKIRKGNCCILTEVLLSSSGRIRSPTGSALNHKSLPPELESRRGHIWMVFRLWFRFITYGDLSIHLAYDVHQSGRNHHHHHHHHHHLKFEPMALLLNRET